VATATAVIQLLGRVIQEEVVVVVLITAILLLVALEL